MKVFLLSLGLGVGLMTLLGVAATRALFPELTAPTPTPVVGDRSAREASFTKAEAVEVVASRFGSSQKAKQARTSLRGEATVEYHSPGHWTVRLGDASWTAHGVGRTYAEPDNEQARQFETELGR